MPISLQIAFPAEEDPNGSSLRFGVSTERGVSKIVSGVRAVEQHFAKLMLTTINSDLFNLNAGTALNEIAREQVTQDNLLALKNDLALAVMSVQNQIVESQSDLDLDASETLLSVDVQEIQYDESTGWSIVVKLNMADGNASQVLLGA